MNEADWLIIVVLVLSALVSLWRGFVREAISLSLWVIAFIIAMTFHPNLSFVLSKWITVEAIQKVIAFAGLFISTLFVGGLLAQILSSVVKKVGLGALDRLLGMVFGVLRGCIIIVVVIVLLPQVVAVEEQQWWSQSAFIPHFAMLEDWAVKVFSEFNSWRMDLIRSSTA